MSQDPPVPTPVAEADTVEVVRRLGQLTGVPVDASAVRAAFSQAAGESREAVLVSAARAVGLRLRPWAGTVAEGWSRARADLPLVTCVEGPAGESVWIVLGAKALGRVDTWEPTSGEPRERLRWKALQQRLGEGDRMRSWWLVEPVAPASDLLGTPGAGLGPFQRLWALLRSERQDLGVVFVYAVAVGVLGLATPVVVQVLVNTVAFGSLLVPIVVLSFVLFLCLAFAAVLRGLKRYVVEMLQRRVFVRMVADLAWRLPRVRLNVFDKQHGPELVNRFFDILTVQKAASSILVDGLSAAIQAAVALVLLAIYHPVLLGFDVFLIVAIIALMVGLGRRGTTTAIRESKVKYQVAGWLEEVAAHPGLFKLTGGAELAVQRADDVAHAYLDARESHFRIFFRQYMGTLFLQVVAASTLLGLGGWLVIERQLSLGQLVAAELVVAAVLSAYAKFAEKLDMFYDLLAGLDKLGTLVDLPLEEQTGTALECRGRPLEVGVHDLSYSFDSNVVLADIDLLLAPGDRVAIFGKDGSGKSIFGGVLAGLRLPARGRVAFDGIDVNELRPDSVRAASALCRGFEVVTGSLAENVRLGRPDLSRRDLLRALEAVGLASVAEALPRGLDTPLAPSGAPLSSTQVMRLMIARAIAGSPRLLVVDQTLDGLDPDSRRDVLEVLSDPRAPWTLVVLTQNPDVLDALPRRYRLEAGRLAPTTPHSRSEAR